MLSINWWSRRTMIRERGLRSCSVTNAHFTINEDFSKSPYFLDGKLAGDIIDAYKTNDVIKSFVTNTSQPEIDIEVKNVALEGMQNSPYKAAWIFIWCTSPSPTTES